MYIIDNKKE